MTKEKNDDLSILKQEPFSDCIKQLEELISQNNRVFLLGAGCSRCAGLPLTSELTDKVLKKLSTSGGKAEKILTAIQKQFQGSTLTTIEDYMSELVDLLAIAERRKEKNSSKKDISLDGVDYDADMLRDALAAIKETIAECLDSKELEIDTHRQFVTAVHHILRSGKTESTVPVDYFVLNYDTLIEDALALECFSYVDGFTGGATGWWDTDTFKKHDSIARVLKVHGSIDWCQLENDLVPRRLRSGGKTCYKIVPKNKVMIWPASTKYQETQKDPFAQILSIMRQSMRPELHSEVVLTICGYRFNDSHINIELERALKESDGRLTLLAFTEFDRPQGQLEQWHLDMTITEQIRIYAKRGFFHGKVQSSADKDLPWWKFENLTRILGGER
ncbi:MAG: SIR2 family protein [Elusimicrobia bacterium]|nr:SIR2 family protein [Elusimicrobiota bacterium]